MDAVLLRLYVVSVDVLMYYGTCGALVGISGIVVISRLWECADRLLHLWGFRVYVDIQMDFVPVMLWWFL